MASLSGSRWAVRGVVGPVRGRVVRQESAPERVAPLEESASGQASAGTPLVPAQRASEPAPDAYDDLTVGFFVYRLRRGAEEHVGVVGDVAVEAFAEGRVRGHEAVRPDRVQALVDHYASGGSRTELVALLHPPSSAVARATALAQQGPPIVLVTAGDGWEQTVWPLPPAATAALAEALDRVPHYVADGHHRVAATLRLWERAGRPQATGVMCVLYPFGSLRVSAFHRRVVGPVEPSDLWSVMEGVLEVRPTPGPTAVGTFDLYVDHGWYAVTRGGSRPPGADGLDVAVVGREVLDPLLGDAPGRVETAADTGDLAELVASCDRDGGALFVLRPPTLDQIVDVADRGEVMPPKTTCFAPKPYAGLFLAAGSDPVS
jgi:uncharacterized protein (DUF1015 family)